MHMPSISAGPAIGCATKFVQQSVGLRSSCFAPFASGGAAPATASLGYVEASQLALQNLSLHAQSCCSAGDVAVVLAECLGDPLTLERLHRASEAHAKCIG